MGNSGDVAPGLVLVGLHPGPQVSGVGAANGGHGGIGFHLAGLVRPVPEDHVAVQVVALDQGCPLVGNKGGEVARVVELFRRVDEVLPHAGIVWVTRLVVQGRRQHTLRELPREFNLRLSRLFATRIESVVEHATGLVRHDVGRTGKNISNRTHAVRVIGNHIKIIGPSQLHRLTGIGGDLLAPGKAVSVAGHQPGSGATGVARESGMYMCVAEEYVGSETTIGVGGVRPFARSSLLAILSCIKGGTGKGK